MTTRVSVFKEDDTRTQCRWWRDMHIVICSMGAMGRVALGNVHAISSSRTGIYKGRPLSFKLSSRTKEQYLEHVLHYMATLEIAPEGDGAIAPGAGHSSGETAPGTESPGGMYHGCACFVGGQPADPEAHVIVAGDFNIQDHREIAAMLRNGSDGQWAVKGRENDFVFARGFHFLPRSGPTPLFRRPHSSVHAELMWKPRGAEHAVRLQEAASRLQASLKISNEEAQEHLERVVADAANSTVASTMASRSPSQSRTLAPGGVERVSSKSASAAPAVAPRLAAPRPPLAAAGPPQAPPQTQPSGQPTSTTTTPPEAPAPKSPPDEPMGVSPAVTAAGPGSSLSHPPARGAGASTLGPTAPAAASEPAVATGELPQPPPGSLSLSHPPARGVGASAPGPTAPAAASADPQAKAGFSYSSSSSEFSPDFGGSESSSDETEEAKAEEHVAEPPPPNEMLPRHPTWRVGTRDDHVLVLADFYQSAELFAEMSLIRQNVIADRMYTVEDKQLDAALQAAGAIAPGTSLQILSPQGVAACQSVHMNAWLNSPNPADPTRTNLEIQRQKSDKRKNACQFRRSCFCVYRFVMHQRFGWSALRFYWEFGFMNEAAVRALNAARRSGNSAEPAGGANAPAGSGSASSAQEPPPKFARMLTIAERTLRAGRRFEVRSRFAQQGPGRCDTCKTRRQNTKRCLRCAGSLCYTCQPYLSFKWAYGRGYLVSYLLCKGCYIKHGGRDLSPEGRVAQRACPTTCDYAEVEATRFARAGLPHPGPLHECFHCNRWICQRCGRDDAPPHVCRQCPHVLKESGGLAGYSVLDPTCTKMPPADPRGLLATSGRPVELSKGNGKRVDCDTALARAREVQDAADAAGAKGTGGESSHKLQQTNSYLSSAASHCSPA